MPAHFQPVPQSFTLTSPTKLRVLITPVHICAAFDPAAMPPDYQPAMAQFQAIWDTGATNTAISENVINTCGLKPIGIAKVGFGGGEQMCETFLINVGLPNAVGFSNVLVNKAKTGPDADVLIGMDVISHGDFAVTNFGGQTTFSFRCPPSKTIDFVKESPLIGVPKVGRNEPCPCNSGKKYKHCHGGVNPPPNAPAVV
jgi:hypothetical protein